ncbi:MAG: hypothetical protein JKY65_19200 [Planctomycetes bacterium]|nr:hypothetical protein [Planctomycetota bacterium]
MLLDEPLTGLDQKGVDFALELFKGCLMGVVGLSIMVYAEWLGFDQEERKREFFQQMDRQQEVMDRVGEDLRKARAARTPIDYSDIWKEFDEARERRRLEREARTPAASPTPTPAPSRSE